jgi:hypothetical protein
MTIPHDIKELIALRSQGHMRNVHMLLDKFSIVGEHSFRDTVLSAEALYCDYLVAVYNNDVARVTSTLEKLSGMKCEELKQDFDRLFVKCMKVFVGSNIPNARVTGLIALWGKDFIRLVRGYFSDWMRLTFTSDYHFMAGMLFFYHSISSEIVKPPITSANPTQGNFVGKRIGT